MLLKNIMNSYSKWIFIRIHIYDIFIAKKEGRIKEKCEKKEHYYKTQYLYNKEYYEKMFEKYPELYRLYKLQYRMLMWKNKIIKSNYEKDKKIINLIWFTILSTNIKQVEICKGDWHKGTGSVSKVNLNSGSIYYKTYCLERNIQYQKIYGYLCERKGIHNKKIKYLSRANYGWEENIENKSCKTREEIKRYYYRMGIHLFLAYSLGATDLHGENIIAHGEYPVIIDMETYPGFIPHFDRSSTKDKAETSLRERIVTSVMRTGMLPVLTWGRENNRVLISAMNMNGKIRTPFKVPVVKDDKTSNIHIEYEQVEFEMEECIVRLNGEAVNSAEYTEYLVQGFQAAYLEMMKDEKIKAMLEKFYYGKSRVVLRHTQQYYMYLFASFHPDYMESREQRKKLLQVMHKDGETQLQKELRDYEIESLLELNIPYFEIDAHSTSIFDGDGVEHTGYLPCTPYESWIEHMKQISIEDMERQCDYIRLSMGLLNKGYIGNPGKEQKHETIDDISLGREIEVQIQKIVNWLIRNAVIEDEDISWAALHFWENGYWSLEPCGMYIYDGIAGITIFLAKYIQIYGGDNCKISRIYELTLNKMKKYTERRYQEIKAEKIGRTGLYDGESSVIYCYLLLYEITGNQEWISWARKHFEVVLRFLSEDKFMDLLSGNAGAIIVSVRLYEITGEEKYLEYAVDIESGLWAKGQETGSGYGWKPENLEVPLAGMAHGNSGFLMAYADLYKITKKPDYLDKIHRLLAYEDALYSEEKKNWLDMRESSGERIMNGWCHGAPGILLVRLKLVDMLPADEQVNKDIKRAAQALFYQKTDSKICLCHGMSGNLLIMQRYLQKYPDRKLNVEYKKEIVRLTGYLKDEQSLLVTERLNPALMNGITGVGMFFLLSQNSDGEFY